MDPDDATLDYGLVSPLAVPADSRVPDGLTEGSGPAEYDRYFRIVRDHPGLPDWTRGCLRVAAELVADLERSSLPAEDRVRVLEGLLAIQRVTLERWVAAAADDAERGTAPGDPRPGPGPGDAQRSGPGDAQRSGPGDAQRSGPAPGPGVAP
ncbi:hypothetical protein [Micromonospora sp. NPDC048830]|uniref:hypothetical protein n=1 Tax=Micromonospora sp. NPDC048830 TaxID=3364257 RepID=UPI00371FA2CA